ncbi:MAG: glycine cleavage system protein GcvH [Actinomycetes bacterium]
MSEASYPEDLLYHQEHDWVRFDADGETALFGITWYAQDALGEVVFYDAPEVGVTLVKDESYAEIESVKAVSDVFAPMSGEVVEVNSSISDEPGVINDDPYGEGWLVKVRLTSVEEKEALMDSAAYTEMLG